MNGWKRFRLRLRALAARLRGDARSAVELGRRIEWDDLEGAEIEVERDGLVWALPIGDYSVARHVFVEGAYPREDLDAVLGWLRAEGRMKADGVFVDVGANLGTPALPFAARTGCRVLAVEPEPATFARLTRNIARNAAVVRVEAIRAAVSAADGELTLRVAGDPSRSEIGAGGTAVPARTLDSLLAERAIAPSAAVLVWSDTQGHERQVIEGGRALWSAGVPLFVEVWPAGLQAQGGVDAFVRSAGSAFTRWIARDDLRAGRAAARPMAEFAAFVKSVPGFSDALLF